MALELRKFSESDCVAFLPDFIELLRDGVDGGASLGFLSPLELNVAESYWQGVFESVRSGATTLLGALDQGRVVATVQLIRSWKPNSPHRADVSKLLVHSQHRRQGIASRLMQELESAALEDGYWLLVLDTELESGAEYLYQKLGFTRLGEIPEYVISNDRSGYLATVYYYKSLRKQAH